MNSKTSGIRHARRSATALLCLSAGLNTMVWTQQALAQRLPPPANSVGATSLPIPAAAAPWFAPQYRSLMQSPLPNLIYNPFAVPASVPATESDANASGTLGTFQPAGATPTATNAFFQPLGTNGRACVTCHAPANAMGLSLASIRARYNTSNGTDPLFAPVDGATCPKNVPANLTSGSLIGGILGLGQSILGTLLGNAGPSPYAALLNKGLIRIPMPVPAGAEFTLAVVSDPYGCNTTQAYDQATDPATGVVSQIVSVYRRPLMSANLKFKTTTAADVPAASPAFPPISPFDFSPLPRDPATGAPLSGNLMWDGREASLSSQAIDATLGHAQARVAPTAAQVAQMVAFENGVYTAQSSDAQAGDLTASGVTGGPAALAAAPAGLLAAAGGEVVTAFDAWNPAKTSVSARRASIYRGQQIFNLRAFTTSDISGFNNSAILTGAPGAPAVSFKASCSTCHGQVAGTTDPLPQGQHDIGVGGTSLALGGVAPATDLPVFRLTCKAGATPGFHGMVVQTNDPGLALVSGRCADIGRFTTPGLHGLAARPPYFSDGSAPSLASVVTFYNNRFAIGLTTQDQADLAAFLATL